MRTFYVASSDGVNIAAVEAGHPGGPEILFIHGFGQSHLSWRKQLTDPALMREFHMVALDLRGHGASDKPIDRAAYLDDVRWADDVAAVIKAANLARPVLVPWSYGGRICSDYLRHHGQDGLAGINWVAAGSRSDPESFGPAQATSRGMFSEVLSENIEGTKAFVRACFERQPSPEEFADILAFNMLVPVKVRNACIGRTANPGDLLPGLRIPVLATHGEKDALVLPRMSEYTVRMVPGAKLSLYEGIGHAPFAEDAPRFNRELAEFVRMCASKRPS